jgi:hypothetical protein
MIEPELEQEPYWVCSFQCLSDTVAAKALAVRNGMATAKLMIISNGVRVIRREHESCM